MFEQINAKFDSLFKTLRGHGKLSERNIHETLRGVRRTLLEADVNYKVAKQFTESIKEKALGEKVIKSITPGQQVVKIIKDEMVALMGSEAYEFSLDGKTPHVILLVGLQGSGKTTFAAKLGCNLRNSGKNPVLVAADIYRPAAVEQLEQLAQQVNIPTYSDKQKTPIDIAKDAVAFAGKEKYDTVIIDTAGRLHVDDEMMLELDLIKKAVSPERILFIADGMSGQDAVNSAGEFAERLDYDGVVLTKLDGDARGGAALSIKAVTGKPIIFVSVGESLDALEKFHPDRMAGRILGMGDVVSLVEKAQTVVDEKAARKLEEKIRKQEFTLEDFLDQLHQLKKMGPIENILGLIPGIGVKMDKLKFDERSLVKTEAIILSMTPAERNNPSMIDGSRRKRIANGSGTSVNDVNKLIKQFFQMKKMLKILGTGRLPKGFKIPDAGILTG